VRDDRVLIAAEMRAIRHSSPHSSHHTSRLFDQLITQSISLDSGIRFFVIEPQARVIPAKKSKYSLCFG
jgi:hypothetical protein